MVGPPQKFAQRVRNVAERRQELPHHRPDRPRFPELFGVDTKVQVN
jgi:hypothetical protein